MIEWIKKNDIMAKAAALLAAIFLWLFVVSMENPVKELPYYNLGVEIEGIAQLEANGLTIIDGADQTVSVTLSGKRDRMTHVREDKIEVTASVASITAPGEYKLNYNVKVDVPDVSVTVKTPTQIELVVDRINTKSVPVELVISGQPAENFVYTGHTLSPDAIVVKGPERILAEIDHARAVYDLTGADASVKTALTYELVDANNEPVDISKLTVETPSVELSMSVLQNNQIPLTVSFVPTDYLTQDMLQYVIDPPSIQVVGEAGVISTLNHIELGNIGLKNMVESDIWVAELPIKLPNGVSAAEGVPSVATVTVTVPGYQRSTFELPAEILPQSGDFTYVEGDVLEITLFGPETEIAQLTQEDFQVTLQYEPNLLAPGENTVPAVVTLESEHIYILEKSFVTIVVPESVE